MSDKPVVSVEDLLPALVELASIRHDLLSHLRGPAYRPAFLALQQPPTLSSLAQAADVALLQARTHELLSWLMSKAGATE